MFLKESEKIWLMWRVLQTSPRKCYLSELQHYPNYYKHLFLQSICPQYAIYYLKVHGLTSTILCKLKVLNLHWERRQVILILELGYKHKYFLTQQLPDVAGRPINDYWQLELSSLKSKFRILFFKILTVFVDKAETL